MRLKERYGPVALITGASSGIGRVFADKLAEAGLDLVICARREELLRQVAVEVTARHGSRVETVAADVATPEGIERVLRACGDVEIGLVVSNAGTGWPGRFGDASVEQEQRLIQLHCQSPMRLAHHFLPGMRARGRGGLLFVSSMMGLHGVPFMASYAATKAYLLSFGEALHHECRDHGVDVLVLAPGATDTPGKDLHDVDYERLPVSFMSAEEVVAQALSGLGRKPLLIPGLKNRLTACLTSGLCLRGLTQRVMRRLAHRAIPALRGGGGTAR